MKIIEHSIGTGKVPGLTWAAMPEARSLLASPSFSLGSRIELRLRMVTRDPRA